jgi:hypothetical protein
MSLATTVWRISPQLVLALDGQLGAPVDSYVNGSQTWFTEVEGGSVLEWRLHPTAGYRLPKALSHYDVWDTVTDQLGAGADPGALSLGAETRPLDGLWDGLECFPAHGDDLEPANLAAAATAALGLAPEAAGLVDHESIGDAWERARGGVSIVSLLLEQLGVARPS